MLTLHVWVTFLLIFSSITSGRVEISKSILLLSKVKILANNTEPVNFLNILGYDLCYSLLMESHKENKQKMKTVLYQTIAKKKHSHYLLTVILTRTKERYLLLFRYLNWQQSCRLSGVLSIRKLLNILI